MASPCCLVPLGGQPVQLGRHARCGATQLQPQQVGEQVVVAEPGAPGVERGDERVGLRQALEDRLRTGGPGEMVGERLAHPLQHRGLQEQLPHDFRLALEHLRHQVGRDGPLAAGELPHEAVGVRVSGERQDGQPQAGGPPLGPVAQQRHALAGELHAAGFEQRARLLAAERQVRRVELDQHAGHAQPVQGEPGVLAHFRQKPERTKIHSQQRHIDRGRNPARRQQGAIPAQHNHQVERMLVHFCPGYDLLIGNVSPGLLIDNHVVAMIGKPGQQVWHDFCHLRTAGP